MIDASFGINLLRDRSPTKEIGIKPKAQDVDS